MAGDKPAVRKTRASAKKPATPSPVKSVLEELEFLRKTTREIIKNYSDRMEAEILQIREVVAGLGDDPDALSSTQIHELRDMLTVMRTLQVKSEKGRRKDLKKLDSAIEDLRSLIDGWN